MPSLRLTICQSPLRTGYTRALAPLSLSRSLPFPSSRASVRRPASDGHESLPRISSTCLPYSQRALSPSFSAEPEPISGVMCRQRTLCRPYTPFFAPPIRAFYHHIESMTISLSSTALPLIPYVTKGPKRPDFSTLPLFLGKIAPRFPSAFQSPQTTSCHNESALVRLPRVEQSASPYARERRRTLCH